MIKIGAFEPKSSYARVLIPILDALMWSGSNKDLLESLAENSNKMNREGLLQTLANLKVRTDVYRSIKNIKGHKLPLLYLTKDSKLYLILNHSNGYITVFNAETAIYEKLENLPKHKEILTFSSIDRVNSNIQRPQKRWFFNLLLRFKREFIYIGIFSFIISAITFTTPLFIILIHSQIRTSPTIRSILFLGVVILSFISALYLLKSRRGYIMGYLGSRMGHIINIELNRRIVFLPPKHLDSISTSSQLTRIKDFESIVDFFSGNSLINMVEIPLSLLMVIGLTIIAGPLAVIPIVAYIITTLITLFSYNIYSGINLRNIATNSEKVSIQTEIISNMVSIRLSGNKNRWIEKYDELVEKSIENNKKSQDFMVIINTISNTIINLSLILTISIGVYLVLENRISVTVLFSTFIIVSRILGPLKGSFISISQLSKLRKSINQLNKFMSLQIEERPGSLNTVRELLKGDIHFNNIFLRYGNEIRPSLININFIQKAGTTTIIKGHGGCGKSSIVQLILGLYAPLSGYISINGINISQLNKIQLRRSIAYLPATPYSFPGTIKDNLYLTKSDASESEISYVLERAGLTDFISSLDKGIDSDISSISNAEFSIIKKINLAMFLLKDSKLCLIDSIEKGFKESDYDLIYNIIRELRGKRTVIITTNNNYFFSLGETIITMDSGRFISINKQEEAKVGKN